MSISLNDGVTLTVEAALSAATGTYGAWDDGVWDTATWGPDVVWTDISAYVRSVATQRKFSRDVQAWSAGTATIVLDNRDARFSPTNLSGPYVTAGVTGVRPWRPVRVRATYNSVVYDVYTGYALSWVESWPLMARTNAGDAIVTVACVDELAKLAAVDGLEQDPIGGGETSGKRVQRLLDAAGHTGARSVDDGRTTVQPTTLKANTASELVLTADSEGGALFIDAAGTVTYQHEYALLENTRSNTVQATFGDGGGAELPYADIEVAYDGDLTSNIASFSRVDGTAQTVYDATSRALYGDRRETRTDLVCESDAQVAGLAAWWVARYKDPEERVTQIAVKPRRSPTTLYPEVLGRQVRDLIRVKRRPPGGITITQDCFVAGVSHSIDVTALTWATTYDLWSATPYGQFTTSRWDVGLWDAAVWFH